MSDELKPCPFCGGDSSIERMGTNRVSMQIVCDDCGCFVESGETWIDWNSKWNMRPIERRQSEQIKKLTEALESMTNFNMKLIDDHNKVNPPWDCLEGEHLHDAFKLLAEIKG